jgi:hypothetical protein
MRGRYASSSAAPLRANSRLFQKTVCLLLTGHDNPARRSEDDIPMHWNQFLALFGRGPEKHDYKIRFRKPLVPAQHSSRFSAAWCLLGSLPHADELLRCIRAQQQGLAGRDTPECARELFG